MTRSTPKKGSTPIDRRQFVKAGGGLLALSAIPTFSHATDNRLPARKLGQTGPIVEGFPPAELVGRPRPQGLELGMPPEERIGFAIVGLGSYATGYIIPNLSGTKNAKLTALVSGNEEKRNAVASTYAIADEHLYDYETFDAIAEDPDVDVVYIITPNVFHRNLVERAFAAGKHVLCEKPMAITAEDCQAMIDAGNRAGKKLMIGYRAQFDPYNLKAIELIRDGRIGTPSTLVADHGHLLPLDVPKNQWRAKQEVAGGGSLYDIGIYNINGARYLLNEEPYAVRAKYHEGSGRPEVTVEEEIEWQMFFPSGVIANCSSSYLTTNNKRIHVQGDKGELTLDPATNYYIRSLKITDRSQENHHIEEIQIPNPNQFVPMLEEMAAAVLEDREPKTPGAEGLQDVRIMEAIYRAAESGEEVTIS
ncbi:putative dehydrogenase [Neolewinella xylanilytica]|uniref:Putative dehydrogenase n=1 Tax=Neolewinella xylanilytica TaxID=1514080 RepID=A0A2S6I969_9BACT|nr:Gfo/Idh/MocA family oxidoreductase [Neolewinella xylanilytica]PPK88046.1 putative dehydrogenase [Neolewinella xylanilytica]